MSDHPEKPSKTQRKKDMIALQKMGEKLAELADSQLADIALPEDLLDAVLHFRTLTSHEAKRRQLQYIGKIMRDIDPEPIQAALKKVQLGLEKKVSKFHHVEQWRDELITEGDAAVQKLLDLYPQADRQQIRQLVRKAQHDRAKNNNTGGSSGLFKYLRDLLRE